MNYTKRIISRGYTGYRPDILKLIQEKPASVLDVGCGAGELGRAIKKNWPDVRVVGIDGDECALEKANDTLDKTIHIDLNKDDIAKRLVDEQTFDIIIFADVLEHLVDPEGLLKALHTKLDKNGYILTSIPNVRHYSTFISLAIFGTWPRRNRGIHDKTHLRFFTKKDIVKMLDECGYKVMLEKRNVRLIERWSWTNIPGKILDFWPFRAFFAFQYIHKSTLK